jgi:hypothetical protein
MFLVACGAQTKEPPGTQTASSTPEPTATPRFTLTPLPTLAATPNFGRSRQVEAMLPEFAGDAGLFPTATRYSIDVNVDFDPGREQGTIEGLSRVQFTNPYSEPLSDIVLVLWPNDRQYRALDMSVPFSVTTAGLIQEGNVHRFGITEGVLFAPTFYPLIPRLMDGEWDARIAPIGGDTTVSDVAFYEVRISVPTDQTLVATGVEVDRESIDDERAATTFVSGPARDFAFALGPFKRSDSDGRSSRTPT